MSTTITQDAPHASTTSDIAIADVERVAAQVANAAQAVEEVIYGQRQVVEECLITVLAGGHGLLIGVPGLAKTKYI